MEIENRSFTIRMIYRNEWNDAMKLAWRTFLGYDAADYTKEGVNSFREFVADSALFRMFLAGSYEVLAAFVGDKMIGVISVRNGNHISLLFVDGEYHRRGVGRALVGALQNYILSEVGGVERITVNSSPYAKEFYHKIGFRDLKPEQMNDGIRYTPMEFIL